MYACMCVCGCENKQTCVQGGGEGGVIMVLTMSN